jgi:hypothetical protein
VQSQGKVLELTNFILVNVVSRYIVKCQLRSCVPGTLFSSLLIKLNTNSGYRNVLLVNLFFCIPFAFWLYPIKSITNENQASILTMTTATTAATTLLCSLLTYLQYCRCQLFLLRCLVTWTSFVLFIYFILCL